MKRGGEKLSPEASSLRKAGGDGSSIEQPAAKRARGRPAGSKNKLKPPVIITCGGGGGGDDYDPGSALRTHVLEIPAGRDLSQCLPAFARRRSLCLSVLSASGPISSATIRQSSPSPSAALTLRGRFDLISLSASFLRSGGGSMSASLAGPQGQVIGGAVAGPLVAAGKVMVVAALFSNPTFHRLPEEEEASGSAASGEEESKREEVDGGAARFGGDGGVWAPAPRRPEFN